MAIIKDVSKSSLDVKEIENESTASVAYKFYSNRFILQTLFCLILLSILLIFYFLIIRPSLSDTKTGIYFKSTSDLRAHFILGFFSIILFWGIISSYINGGIYFLVTDKNIIKFNTLGTGRGVKFSKKDIKSIEFKKTKIIINSESESIEIPSNNRLLYELHKELYDI